MCIICGRTVAVCLVAYIVRLHAFPNQMTYLSYSVQVHHSTFLGPSTNKVISVLPGCRVLAGKHAEGKGKGGRWVKAKGRINKDWCKKCGRPAGLETPLQRTSVKQLKERGGDRGENAGIERKNSQREGKQAKEEKQVSTACHWPPGMNNPSQIDLPARPSRAFWINLKLISVPEVGKTCSGAYQKYSGAGRIWQGNLSQCTTGNGPWAPRVARGRVCCSHTHTQIRSVCTQHNHWWRFPSVQHRDESVYCALAQGHKV